MIGSTIISLVLTGMVFATPEHAWEPWATTNDYFKVVERGFHLDAMPHHVHFIEKGKVLWNNFD